MTVIKRVLCIYIHLHVHCSSHFDSLHCTFMMPGTQQHGQGIRAGRPLRFSKKSTNTPLQAHFHEENHNVRVQFNRILNFGPQLHFHKNDATCPHVEFEFIIIYQIPSFIRHGQHIVLLLKSYRQPFAVSTHTHIKREISA